MVAVAMLMPMDSEGVTTSKSRSEDLTFNHCCYLGPTRNFTEDKKK